MMYIPRTTSQTVARLIHQCVRTMAWYVKLVMREGDLPSTCQRPDETYWTLRKIAPNQFLAAQ